MKMRRNLNTANNTPTKQNRISPRSQSLITQTIVLDWDRTNNMLNLTKPFRILSQEMLQQEIQQNKGDTTYNLNIYVKITLGGLVAISVPIGLYFWSKRKREKEGTSQVDKTKPRKKRNAVAYCFLNY